MTEKEILCGSNIIAEFLNIPIPHKIYNKCLGKSKYNTNYNWIMPVFFEIQNRYYCGGSIIENEVEFYTLGYCMDTIVHKTNDSSEPMVETIFKCCVEAIELYKINPEKFISRK